MKTYMLEGGEQVSKCCHQLPFSLAPTYAFAKDSIVLNGIKTKLDNANRFPIRQADTPVQKRFLNKTG
ncbi:MAG TPA: hypothetical protein VGI88_10775 [Verrucomicrobiae bacterium]